MSSSPDYMQQLLGGLLNNSQPNVTSGLLSGNDPTTNLGLQLMANSNSGGHFGQIFGTSALQAQQQGMQNTMQRLQMAQGLQGLTFNMQKNQALMDALGGGSPQGQQAAPSLGGSPGAQQPFYPGVSQMPANGQPSAQPSSQQDSMPQQVAGYSASDISQIPIGGVPPQVYRKLALLQGKDPIEVEKEMHARQLQTIQESVAPQLSALDTVIKSDKPTQYVQADPQLRAQWQQIAPKLGINPQTGFTDQNVRTAFGFSRNKLASQAQLPSDAPIVPETTQNGPLGSIYQTNPITGKKTQVKGEEDLKQVIDPKSGQPVLVPASKAAGMTPYNASQYGAASLTDQAKEFAYQTYVTTHKLPESMGRSPAMQASMLDYIAKRAGQDGNSAASLAANGQLFQARQGAEKSFAPGGSDYKTTQFLNTAIAHLDTMRGLAQALGNNFPVQAVEKFKNAVSTQFGGTAPTNAAAAASIVGAEVTKAIVANGGSAAEREEAGSAFSNAKTWPQLEGVINTYQQLLGGQLETRRNSYEQTFHRNDFDTKFLTPRTRQALGISESAPATSGAAPSTGWGQVVVHP